MSPMEDGVIVNDVEAVAGPCGMSNAQAALIAAVIKRTDYNDEAVTDLANRYKAWLDDMDSAGG